MKQIFEYMMNQKVLSNMIKFDKNFQIKMKI